MRLVNLKSIFSQWGPLFLSWILLVQCATREEVYSTNKIGEPARSFVYRDWWGIKSKTPYLQREYFLNHSLKMEVALRGKQKHGFYRAYYRSGDLHEEGKYQDGLREGEFKTFFKETKEVMSISYYQRGELEGKYQTFWRPGKIQIEGMYRTGKKVGEWKKYSASGVLMEKNSCFSQNQKGYLVSYHRNGEKKDSVSCLDGLKEGKFISWSPEGIVLENGNFSAGKKTGKWLQWHPNQKLKSQSSYVNDLLSDSIREFSEDGHALAVGKFENGTGEKIEYGLDGKIVRVTMYRLGQLHGQEWRYDSTGLPRAWILWENGKAITTKRWYIQQHPLDTLLESEGFFKEGIKHGTWRWWDRSGYITEKAEYQKGLREGPTIIYRKGTNQPMMINHYQKGAEVRSEIIK